RKFEIKDDMFWKDNKPFRIIGGDLHYFRVHPEYWEDRLLRAKALGLNTIQTYVPWNLHEPRKGELVFHGFADIVSFLKLCEKLDLLVMLRAGPYICGEWDLGGFPSWLLTKDPPIRLRSSDPAFIELVNSWWSILLPKIHPLVYRNGGSVVMIQIENEFGSFGDDKAYLHNLVVLARSHLGSDVVLYTTDGGTRETLEKGTIMGDDVFSAVDFSTGDDPWPIFQLQKKFNPPGKSPPLSAEFYTGWLTHWNEEIASTDAEFTATYLEKILSMNGSVVLYMVHGGTNFGFYSGANTGVDESDYKPDLTSYDYDAPIREYGDVKNAKYEALRKVIAKYGEVVSVPPDNEKTAYGRIKLEKQSSLFDMISYRSHVLHSKNPISMEAAFQQMFGFVLYSSEYVPRTNGSSTTLIISIGFILQVHDRAQVFISCPEKRPTYIGLITRSSNRRAVDLPYLKCGQGKNKLLILVENMGHLNYGPYIFDRKGILSSVYLDGREHYEWEMFPISLQNLNEDINPDIAAKIHRKGLAYTNVGYLTGMYSSSADDLYQEPAFYVGHFHVERVGDTFISFRDWSKGIAFVNNNNIGRFWPSVGPQCSLYVPAPFLREGTNTLVILELESPSSELYVSSVDHPDFTC
ncbi:beta-galactosidase, partial [Genlisea aurea]